ncbi:MAG TPA: hypothetical protein PLY79_02875, partial [Ferruginibacter sp.]|nr:hypothetical protein [Ferruginibacter sp.]
GRKFFACGGMSSRLKGYSYRMAFFIFNHRYVNSFFNLLPGCRPACRGGGRKFFACVGMSSRLKGYSK